MIRATVDTQPSKVLLAAATRRLHRALLEGLLATGEVPLAADLAGVAGIDESAVPERLWELVEADYAGCDETGRLRCLYPLSVGQTPHVVTIDGRRRYAMCAIDALGVAAMLGQAVVIETGCVGCGTAMRIELCPGALMSVAPPGAVVVARLGSEEPAREVCCPVTVFACGAEDAQAFAERTPGTHILALEEARGLGEALFGDLRRADVLPATRRRPQIVRRATGAGTR